MPNNPNNTNFFLFAEVILPLSIEGTFTYEIPENLKNKLHIGQRAVVSFGGKKLYTGIIHSFHKIKPELYKVKPIIDVLEDFALVTPIQLKLWQWMADYYLNTLGEVYRNALPTALKLESETFIKKNNAKTIEWELLDEYETLILQGLENKNLLSLKELEAFIPSQKIISVVKTLYEEHWIDLDEKLKEKYKPKKIKYIRLNPLLKKDNLAFNLKLKQLLNAPKQREYLLALLDYSTKNNNIVQSVFLKEFNFSNSLTKSLEKKQIIETYTLEQDRLTKYNQKTEDIFNLTTAQKQSLKEIKHNWKQTDVNLLHGVTSSGKTEIYIHLIKEQLELQQSSLLLLPEISITTQLIQRFRKKFGNKAAVYHSKLNTQERVEIYKKILSNKLKIIIGARSALFLPFTNLGLVIIDEEHETSYKQETSKPYFNAKDSAIVMAKISKSKVLLGSATPSLESLYNCKLGKYKKVTLGERYGEVLPPKIKMITLQNEPPYTGEISNSLEKEINTTLLAKKQVILFQNRRGYTPVLECIQCNYVANCPNCDVKLTYHKTSKNLKCHYCNHQQATPVYCPVCQSQTFDYKGLGTQKIEEEVLNKFKEYNIFRMDSDTMRRKHAYEKLFEQFESQEIDILIGTQMITKGLDFSNVGLVATVKADALLNIPDFRVEEKTYQLLTQVAGRAGRRKEQGLVSFQTHQPNHRVFKAICNKKEDVLIKDLLQERKEYNYPPYYKLIEITFYHTKKEKVEKFAQYFTESLYSFIPEQYILGPVSPSIGRINNKYIYNTLLKLPLHISHTSLKKKLKKQLSLIGSISGFKSIKVKVMVDPV